MATTLRHFEAVLAPLPHLLPPVLDALNEDREVDTTFFLDPVVMQLAQSYGRGNVLGPLYPLPSAGPGCGLHTQAPGPGDILHVTISENIYMEVLSICHNLS